jgi:hypothetical protein
MNDNDLISRAAAIDALKRAAYWQDAERKIAELPAVDAVPVVRCEDCKCAEFPRMAAICSRFYGAGGHGFFCAAGERRDDVTTRTAEQR